jgi:restriction endonuclease S subunit
MKFKQIASIISGYAFRGAIEADWNGNIFVMQARNVVGGEAFKDVKDLTPVTYEGVRGLAFLQKGDVLVVSRGAGKGSFKASVFESENENTLATSSLLVIRLTSKKILPEYLVAYLNSDLGQDKLLETVSGSYIQAISRKKLEELEIPAPPIEKQDLLVKLYINMHWQQKIKARQGKLYKQIINTAFSKITQQ